MLSQPGTDEKHVYLMHCHVSTSSSDVVFTAITSKNDVTLCKLDVYVQNRTAVVVASNSLNLSRISLKEKNT